MDLHKRQQIARSVLCTVLGQRSCHFLRDRGRLKARKIGHGSLNYFLLLYLRGNLPIRTQIQYRRVNGGESVKILAHFFGQST